MALIRKTLSPRKEPNQDRSKETVERIITSAAHILEKDGLEKASTNKIAEDAGISIGSLYQYFPSKDAILALMMERHLKSEMKMIEKELLKLESNDLKSTIKVLVHAALEGKRKNARFTKILAQKIFSMGKISILNEMDKYLLDLFKKHMGPFENELRKENLDLSFFIVINSCKIIPVSILFQDKHKLSDPEVEEEMVHLIYSYLKKP